MADEAQEKKHDPSAKRLSKLHGEGTILRSRDLTGALVFTVTVLLLIFMSESIKNVIKNDFVDSFTGVRKTIIQPEYIGILIKTMVIKNFKLILPVFIVSFVVTLLSPFLFGGWNFTLQVLEFKFHKLNPTNNLLKLFSIKETLIQIFRSTLKSFFLAAVLIGFIFVKAHEIKALMTYTFQHALDEGSGMVKEFVIILTVALVVLVIIDMIYNQYTFMKQHRMTSQELKDESKDVEGNLDVKRKIRSKQFALLKQRLQASVPKASVIITNPTHYAIALRYDNGKDRAPKVMAKGQGPIAQEIRQIAIAHGIPIYEAPPLARAIYYTTNLGAEIHPGLYMAVAIVLSYVNQLKNYQMGKGHPPRYVDNLEIPKELIYPE